MAEHQKIGIVVLAAGASGRLGEPKQLVSFQGKPLLQHVLNIGNSVNIVSKIVVLGANSDSISKSIQSGDFEIEINKNWQKGMGESLHVGVKKLLEKCLDLQGILILVSDQPFVSEELLHDMLNVFKTEDDIVLCEYKGIRGVPGIFGRKYFSELLKLEGDQGAKKIMKAHPNKLKSIKFELGDFDIDTPEDYKKLKEFESSHQTD